MLGRHDVVHPASDMTSLTLDVDVLDVLDLHDMLDAPPFSLNMPNRTWRANQRPNIVTLVAGPAIDLA